MLDIEFNSYDIVRCTIKVINQPLLLIISARPLDAYQLGVVLLIFFLFCTSTTHTLNMCESQSAWVVARIKYAQT